MSFPLNPVNGQKNVINGIKYVYSSTTNSWRRDFNNVLDRLFLVGQNQADLGTTSTGDLVVYGGGRFGKNLIVDGALYVSGTSTFVGTITGVITTANSVVSVQGGARGSLLYQSTGSTTAFIPIATTGSILLSNGVIPIWTTTAAITAAYSITATNLLGGGQWQIPFQSNPGLTTFSSSLTYNTTTLTIGNQTPSANTVTGALVVAGGVGIGGNLYVGGNFTINGTTSYLNTTNLDVTDKNITISKNSPDATSSDGAGLTVDGPTTKPTFTYSALDDSWNVNKLFKGTTLRISSNTTAASTITGAVIVTGGVGVGGTVFATAFTGPLTGTVGSGATKNTGAFTTVDITSTVNSTTPATGALTIAGGAGVTGNIYVGGTANTVFLAVTSSTNSTSISSGAAVITGGAGVGLDLWVGGTIYGVATNSRYSNTATLALLANTATNIASGSVRQIPFQSATGLTTFSPNLTFTGTTLGTNKIVVTTSTSDILPSATIGIDLVNTGVNQSPAIRFAGLSSGIVMMSSFGTLKVLSDATTLTNTLLSVGLTTVEMPIVTSSFNTGTGSLVVGGGIGVGGNVNIGGYVNPTLYVNSVVAYTSSTGIVTHNLLFGNVFYHSSMVGNFTAAFVNAPTTSEKTFTVDLVLTHGASTFYANSISINSSAQPIKWSGAQTLTPNNINVERLTFIRVNGSWTVLGEMRSYI